MARRLSLCGPHRRLLDMLPSTNADPHVIVVPCEACGMLHVQLDACASAATCSHCHFVTVLSGADHLLRPTPEPLNMFVARVSGDGDAASWAETIQMLRHRGFGRLIDALPTHRPSECHQFKQPASPDAFGRAQLAMLYALYELPKPTAAVQTAAPAPAAAPAAATQWSLVDWLLLPPGSAAEAAAAQLAASEAAGRASAAFKASTSMPPPAMPPPPHAVPLNATSAPAAPGGLCGGHETTSGSVPAVAGAHEGSTQTPSPVRHASQNSSSGGSTAVGGGRRGTSRGGQAAGGATGGGVCDGSGEGDTSLGGSGSGEGGPSQEDGASSAPRQPRSSQEAGACSPLSGGSAGSHLPSHEGQHDGLHRGHSSRAAEAPPPPEPRDPPPDAPGPIGALLLEAAAVLSAAARNEKLMGAADWGWAYGRAEALHGARATRARCGPRVVAALLEEESMRRVPPKRRWWGGGAGPSATHTDDDDDDDGDAIHADGDDSAAGGAALVGRLEHTLARIGGEMRAVVSRLDMPTAPSLGVVPPGEMPEGGGSSTGLEWCDLRALRPGDTAARPWAHVGEEALPTHKEAASALRAKFELWRSLGVALARHRAALVA